MSLDYLERCCFKTPLLPKNERKNKRERKKESVAKSPRNVKRLARKGERP